MRLKHFREHMVLLTGNKLRDKIKKRFRDDGNMYPQLPLEGLFKFCCEIYNAAAFSYGNQEGSSLIRRKTHLKHLKVQLIHTELNQGTDRYRIFGQCSCFFIIPTEIKRNIQRLSRFALKSKTKTCSGNLLRQSQGLN